MMRTYRACWRHTVRFSLLLFVPLIHSGCSGNSEAIGQWQAETDKRIQGIMGKVEEIDSRLQKIEERMGGAFRPGFLRVIVPELPLRGRASKESPQLGMAYENAICRELSCVDAKGGACSWYKAECMSGTVPLIGFVFGASVRREELDDAMYLQAGREYRVRLAWEREVIERLKESGARSLGIASASDSESAANVLRDRLASRFIEAGISVKIVDGFEDDKVTSVCQSIGVGALVRVSLVTDDQVSIRAFESNGFLLYLQTTSLKSIDMN